MLRLPIYGFAKPVDYTVARAMTILQNREDYTAKGSGSTPVLKPQKPNVDRAWR